MPVSERAFEAVWLAGHEIDEPVSGSFIIGIGRLVNANEVEDGHGSGRIAI